MSAADPIWLRCCNEPGNDRIPPPAIYRVLPEGSPPYTLVPRAARVGFCPLQPGRLGDADAQAYRLLRQGGTRGLYTELE